MFYVADFLKILTKTQFLVLLMGLVSRIRTSSPIEEFEVVS